MRNTKKLLFKRYKKSNKTKKNTKKNNVVRRKTYTKRKHVLKGGEPREPHVSIIHENAFKKTDRNHKGSLYATPVEVNPEQEVNIRQLIEKFEQSKQDLNKKSSSELKQKHIFPLKFEFNEISELLKQVKRDINRQAYAIKDKNTKKGNNIVYNFDTINNRDISAIDQQNILIKNMKNYLNSVYNKKQNSEITNNNINEFLKLGSKDQNINNLQINNELKKLVANLHFMNQAKLNSIPLEDFKIPGINASEKVIIHDVKDNLIGYSTNIELAIPNTDIKRMKETYKDAKSQKLLNLFDTDSGININVGHVSMFKNINDLDHYYKKITPNFDIPVYKGDIADPEYQNYIDSFYLKALEYQSKKGNN